ncbi:MAG TPA: IS30 family transposase [Acidobacteriota bacterium]|nr:IS30 family transposase [Acidobacteriota bacterium]
MGQKYHQISIEERCEIARLRAEGCSLRQIAAALDREPSTIARELKRNRGQNGAYRAVYADQQSRARRWTGSRLDRDSALRRTVLSGLKRGWSPEQVAGRLARDTGARVISYETIYRFIQAQIVRTKDYTWRHYLPRGKSKRGWRGRKGGSPALLMAHRRPLSERPEDADDRRTPGHWEADLMLFKTYGHIVLMLHERQSRLLLAARLPSKAAAPVAQVMARMLAPLPPPWRRTITFDNGTEFACHYDLHALDIQTFFCDTHAPWQKGGIENAIGRMRRHLPRKTDLADFSDRHLLDIFRANNNTPRKCLDFQTPIEVFWDQVLHFKCESTPPLSRG